MDPLNPYLTSPSPRSAASRAAIATFRPSRASSAATDGRVGFVLELGRALHRYGTPAHRLEEVLTVCAAKLNLEAQFFSTPTSLFASFGTLEDQRTYLIRIDPGESNIAKLAAIDEVLADLLADHLAAPQAARRVRDIVEAPARWSPLTNVAFTGVVGGATAAFFGGRFQEIIPAALVGLAVGGLMLLVARRRHLARVIELIAGALAAFAATLADHFLGPVSTYTIMVSGIILFLPGLTLTIAMNELATRHLVAGTARLMGAVMALVSLGFGVALGLRLGAIFPGPGAVTLAPHPWWLQMLALAIAATGFTVLFAARARDYLWIFIAAVLGLYGSRLGSILLGPELGACFGAFLVAAAGNFYARSFHRPAATMILPGLLILVPGTIGFTSFQALLHADVTGGIDAAFRVILVAVSIVAGLLLANVAVAPRRLL